MMLYLSRIRFFPKVSLRFLHCYELRLKSPATRSNAGMANRRRPLSPVRVKVSVIEPSYEIKRRNG